MSDLFLDERLIYVAYGLIFLGIVLALYAIRIWSGSKKETGEKIEEPTFESSRGFVPASMDDAEVKKPAEIPVRQPKPPEKSMVYNGMIICKYCETLNSLRADSCCACGKKL